MYICRFGSRPEIADLMNTDISQLFRGEQQGTPWVLANGHVPVTSKFQVNKWRRFATCLWMQLKRHWACTA